ncbi:MAG: DUF5615 family PIN-like protein [Promethearchaeota archaeon]
MKNQHILFDENLSISPKTLSGQLHSLLEKQGWTCHSVHDFPDLIGHADENVIAYAKENGWALLTLDKRMAYLAVKERVDVYLVLHEKSTDNTREIEELTVVHIEPFADVQAQTSFEAKLVSND